MEDRLLKLLDVEQLSSSKFADAIGVQRSSVSHILSGRNKPSFNFLQKTLKVFPLLNADWLILGEGKMYESEVITGGGNLFDQAESIPQEKSNLESIESLSPSEIASAELNISDTPVEIPEEFRSETDKTADTRSDFATSSKEVRKVILLYDDNSFVSYNPGE